MLQEEQKKILVVEDEAMIRRAIIDRLEAESFLVFSAENGIEALEKARAERPDLILLDIVMPEMGGVEASEKLGLYEETKNIPIMFLTNLSDTSDILKTIKREGYEYLVKAEWDIADVVEKIKAKVGV